MSSLEEIRINRDGQVVKSKKQKKEQFFVEEFLRFTGMNIQNLEIRDKPDAFAKVSENSQQILIGIETTYYYIDAKPGESSPGHAAFSTWGRIEKHISEKIKQYHELKYIKGTVSLNKKLLPPQKEQEHFINQLLLFINEYVRENNLDSEAQIWTKRIDDKHNLIKKYIKKLRLKNQYPDEWPRWHCTTVYASGVGMNNDILMSIIDAKTNACKSYDWRDCDERWLLICAPGCPIVATAGPVYQLDDLLPELVDACKRSGFTKIFFWERMHDWAIEFLSSKLQKR